MPRGHVWHRNVLVMNVNSSYYQYLSYRRCWLLYKNYCIEVSTTFFHALASMMLSSIL